MNRQLNALVLTTSFIAITYVRPVAAKVDIDIHVGVPPPPAVVFSSEPAVVVIPRTHVYYVPEATEYDMYRVGPYWYVNRSGYWYRSRAYRGPFAPIEYRRLPHALVVVPVAYRRHPLHPHGGPPGQLKHLQHWKKARGHGRHGGHGRD